MRRPLTSPTLLVLWSRGTPQSRTPQSRTLRTSRRIPPPSWKSHPLLPSKPCRTTSALIGRSYMVAGQLGAALHTMAILQAYQAEVLKEMDEGDGVTPEAVKELRRATNLALRATKHTARAVGLSLATAERHLWLNLMEKAFLLDAPISSSGLFGYAVNAVVDKFNNKQFMLCRAREPASSSCSRERLAPSKEPVGRVSEPMHPPRYTVWGDRGRSASRQHPHKWVDLKPLNKPPRRLLRVAPDTRIRKRRASPTLLDRNGPLKHICPSLGFRILDPVNCPVGSVLEFLRHKFSAGAAATTLRVCVAAIAARRDSDDVPRGRHLFVSSFMRGAKRLRPVCPPSFPSWDLSVVLKGLLEPPFEPLESAPVRILTLKVALASFKRVGDFQALSVSEWRPQRASRV